MTDAIAAWVKTVGDRGRPPTTVDGDPIPLFSHLTAITGAGKTPILASVIRKVGPAVVLWTTNRSVVVDQTVEKLRTTYRHFLPPKMAVIAEKPTQSEWAALMDDEDGVVIWCLTVASWNDTDEGTKGTAGARLNIHRPAPDWAGERSPWEQLGDISVRKRPLWVIYDESQGQTDVQLDQLLDLHPHPCRFELHHPTPRDRAAGRSKAASGRMTTRTIGTDVLRYLEALWQPGEVREVRIPRHNRFGHTASGYFSSPAAAAEAVAAWDGQANVYVTLNPVDPALRARAAEHIVAKAEHTSADVDVTGRRWLLVDVDPVRPAGVSSTDGELAGARAVLDTAVGFLTAQGWPEPLVALSGNGYHALYRVDLPNDAESLALVQGVLTAVAEQADTAAAKVDPTVANASRITALIGTLKMKGDSIPERPHRRSRVERLPDLVDAAPLHFLTAVAALSRPAATPGPTLRVGLARAPREASSIGPTLGTASTSPGSTVISSASITVGRDGSSGRVTGGATTTRGRSGDLPRTRLAIAISERSTSTISGVVLMRLASRSPARTGSESRRCSWPPGPRRRSRMPELPGMPIPGSSGSETGSSICGPEAFAPATQRSGRASTPRSHSTRPPPVRAGISSSTRCLVVIATSSTSSATRSATR